MPHGGRRQAFRGRLSNQHAFRLLLAPNITPDAETGIGLWTADEFYRALHEGVNRRSQDMYPAMPYVFYTRVTRADSDAIFAYLRTVAPVRNAVAVNHLRFPFNQRWTMAGWRELFFDEGALKPDPAASASWNRGAYLVEGLGHCSACHSPRDVLGGIERRHEYTGAEIDGWFAPNISSNLYVGLGSWTADQIATYLEDRRTQGRHHCIRTDGRSRAQQHEPAHGLRSRSDGRVPEVAASGVAVARGEGGAGGVAGSRRLALHGPL